MQNAERQRLVSTMSHEPLHALGTVLKCSICLAILILLAVIGNTQEQVPSAHEARKDAAASTSAAGTSDVAAHRRQVFEQRRANSIGNASERDAREPSLASRAAVVAP